MLRARAQLTPSAKVTSTEPTAKAMFQTNVVRKGPEIAGSVMTRVKLRSPTLTRQPWANRPPELSTKDPLALSAVHTCPVVLSVMQSHAAS